MDSVDDQNRAWRDAESRVRDERASMDHQRKLRFNSIMTKVKEKMFHTGKYSLNGTGEEVISIQDLRKILLRH